MTADKGFYIGHRISIVGKTGSGKTTLGQNLAACLDIPHIELDAIYWLPNWQGRNRDEFVQIVTEKLGATDCWVVDGNYNSAVRPIVWQHADTVIWLDYPMWIIYWRLTKRTLMRVVRRETLWSGNRERLIEHFGQDSLFLHARRQHRRHRQNYPRWLAQPKHQHLTLLHLHSPHETQQVIGQAQTLSETTP